MHSLGIYCRVDQVVETTEAGSESGFEVLKVSDEIRTLLVKLGATGDAVTAVIDALRNTSVTDFSFRDNVNGQSITLYTGFHINKRAAGTHHEPTGGQGWGM